MRFMICKPFSDYQCLNTEFDHSVLLSRKQAFGCKGTRFLWLISKFSKLAIRASRFFVSKSCGIELPGYVWEQLLVILMDEFYILSTTTVCLIFRAADVVSHSI
jgi:hypothetical protein